ncbi:MAG: tyrosine-type recombinase/integrase [Promethearchaeota archaeon]
MIRSKMDIHNYKKRLERILVRIKESDISQKNKDLIFEFHNHCFTEGLSVCKIERYLFDLRKLALMLNKDLKKVTKDDLKGIVAEIEKKEWSPHTKHAFKVMIRKFYRFEEGIDEKGVYPEKVKWLRSTVKHSQQKLPEELLTEEEIKKMIIVSRNERDKALIAILYESGCRISEIGLLRLKDISFDDYGAKITVSGKTGTRRIRIVNSVPYLQSWINQHSDNQNTETYIFVNRLNNKVLSYTRLSDIIKELARKAGIKKRVYPHLLRHSRATSLAGHLTEAQMKDYLGWTQSSKMAAVYVHLSGRDTDNAILKLSGIQIDENEKPKEELKFRECVRCKKKNEVTNKFCNVCGLVLEDKEANKMIERDFARKETDDFMNKIVNNKEMLEMLVKKIAQMK